MIIKVPHFSLERPGTIEEATTTFSPSRSGLNLACNTLIGIPSFLQGPASILACALMQRGLIHGGSCDRNEVRMYYFDELGSQANNQSLIKKEEESSQRVRW